MPNYFSKLKRPRRRSPTGSIRADPNPIPISDFGREGVTRLSWTTHGTGKVEVHMDAPDGPLISSNGPKADVRTTTFRRNETVFYLQDVSGGLPLNDEHTLDTVTVYLFNARFVGDLPTQIRATQ